MIALATIAKTFFSGKLGHVFLYALPLLVFGATEYFMPLWAQILIGLAAILVAGGVVWKKLIQPLAKLITLMGNILPLMNELVEQFKDTPHVFEILNSIVREFRTDSGSTLRDVVNRLEKAANENKISSEVLATNAETARLLSAQDRTQVAQLVQLLDVVSAKQREHLKTTDRIEAGNKIVASDLDEAQTRAENTMSSEAGAAADAAAKKTK